MTQATSLCSAPSVSSSLWDARVVQEAPRARATDRACRDRLVLSNDARFALLKSVAERGDRLEASPFSTGWQQWQTKILRGQRASLHSTQVVIISLTGKLWSVIQRAR